jgi:ubiquitin carboxyl-terminal hydrolase 47
VPETVPEEVWEEEPERKQQAKKVNFKSKVVSNPKVTAPVIDLKKKKGSASAETKNFLDEIRAKTKQGIVGNKQIEIEIYTTPDQIANEEDIEMQRVLLQQHKSSENPSGETIDENKDKNPPSSSSMNEGNIQTSNIVIENAPIAPPDLFGLPKAKKRSNYDGAEECISPDDEPSKPTTKRKLQTDPYEERKKQQEEELANKKKKRQENFENYLKDREEKISQYLRDGPLVYELYGILIHSGGAYGGHYYTYIKSFEDGKWYNFNDSTVTELDVGDIPAHCFGGGKQSNAYMLLYRQIEENEEKIKITNEDIPSYIKVSQLNLSTIQKQL